MKAEVRDPMRSTRAERDSWNLSTSTYSFLYSVRMLIHSSPSNTAAVPPTAIATQ